MINQFNTTKHCNCSSVIFEFKNLKKLLTIIRTKNLRNVLAIRMQDVQDWLFCHNVADHKNQFRDIFLGYRSLYFP